ncbi:MAG: methyltransferase [Treponema sp.]|nr:methyltransferase [Treponema sp.]
MLQEKPLDFVITDPPWGFYEEIGDIKDFYEKMFDSLKKVLKKEGQIIILSARKEEIESVAEKCSFVITDSIHTLVNGKKAALYKMVLNN